jgi:hypothetical protein
MRVQDTPRTAAALLLLQQLLALHLRGSYSVRGGRGCGGGSSGRVQHGSKVSGGQAAVRWPGARTNRSPSSTGPSSPSHGSPATIPV